MMHISQVPVEAMRPVPRDPNPITARAATSFVGRCRSAIRNSAAWAARDFAPAHSRRRRGVKENATACLARERNRTWGTSISLTSLGFDVP